MVSGPGPAPCSTGSDRSVSAFPLSSLGIVVAPSIATISVRPPGSVRCNSADALGRVENAARTLSADTFVIVAGGAIASADAPSDFRNQL